MQPLSCWPHLMGFTADVGWLCECGADLHGDYTRPLYAPWAGI